MRVRTQWDRPTPTGGQSAACYLLPAVLIFLCYTGHGWQATEALTSREYKLKAAFLYNFAQFTEWPTNALASTNAPFVIGVVGENPFGPALEEIARGGAIRGHPLKVNHCSRIQDIRDCRILFISLSEKRSLKRIVNRLKNKPVLTVSDAREAIGQGVMTQLATRKNRPRLLVNKDAAVSAGRTLSSRLLQVAGIVPAKKP